MNIQKATFKRFFVKMNIQKVTFKRFFVKMNIQKANIGALQFFYGQEM